jgi:hypothetical protein
MLGSYANLPAPPTPDVAGWPLPLLLLTGGVACGVLLAGVCRILVAGTARARARDAERRLRGAIGQVSQELVLAPVEEELAAYRQVRIGLLASLR